MPDNGLGELERLTPGETLLIDRRRRNESQFAAAKRLGLAQFQYGQMERDDHDWSRKVKIGKLKPHERCLLYRRRAEKTQEEVAKELPCCRWWLNQMERGVISCDDLIWYWEQ